MNILNINDFLTKLSIIKKSKLIPLPDKWTGNYFYQGYCANKNNDSIITVFKLVDKGCVNGFPIQYWESISYPNDDTKLFYFPNIYQYDNNIGMNKSGKYTIITNLGVVCKEAQASKRNNKYLFSQRKYGKVSFVIQD